MYTITALKLERISQFVLTESLKAKRKGMDQLVDVSRGPDALRVMGIEPDIIFCYEAWPHTHLTWEGRLFFTLTLEGDRYRFGCASKPDEVFADKGKTLVINPMELHWLRPDPVVSRGWLALQWDVLLEDADAFAGELAKAIETWNQPEFPLPILGN